VCGGILIDTRRRNMGKVTFGDVTLKNITLESLPRLGRLREVHFNTRPEVCVELASLLTEYMKKQDDRRDSPEHRAGKRLKYILEHKKGLIRDDDLLAGTTTFKMKGVPIYPQFLGQALWPELETLRERKKNPYNITKTDIDTLNFEVFPFWMNETVQEVCRRDYGNPFCLRMMERMFFFLGSKAHTISHTVPDYESVVKEGLASIIEKAEQKEAALGEGDADLRKRDLYKAVILSLQGVIAYARKLRDQAASLAATESDPERKGDLLEMSRLCDRVPENRSNTFHEALQAVWIAHVAINQESNNVSNSLGRLDQILYPLYRKDIEEGTLTPARAVELVGCFYLKLADHEPMSPETAEELFGGSGSNQAITLGGVDASGRDAVNDLTYVMLKATELLKVKDPNVNVRYHPGVNPKEYLSRLCEVNLVTRATPCFHNDIENIRILSQKDGPDGNGSGYSIEDARDYSIVGCVEPVKGGKTFGHTGAVMFNLTSALEMALFQGKHRHTGEEQFGPVTPPPERISSFEDFLAAFDRQTIFMIEQSVELNNMLGRVHHKVNPLPFLSALTQGALEAGLDVLEGGAAYNSSGVAVIGLSEVVDSLCAINEFGFGDRGCTFPDLLKAIKADWVGHEKLRNEILCSGTKFGTDSQAAADMADRVVDLLHAEFQKRENYRGGKYRVGYWTMTTHAGWGKLTGALPSGRRKGEVLPSGITPVSGQAPDLTPALRFVARLDSSRIKNSYALNLKFTPMADGDRMISSLAGFIEGYMQMGGLQVQCNIIDRATLEDAKVNPRNHLHLLVRVSGYTAYFTDLNPHMQEEIITRTEYVI
jgi:pyruvate formate-lyase/glycerol dehydratase family glycyl radical enzyme